MTPTGHSPLGFSGAERYFNCPGSVALIASLPPGAPEGDPEYRLRGTMAHEAWAWCLREGRDAWEATDQSWVGGYWLTADDVIAGQVYIDDARACFKAVPYMPTPIILIEEQFHAPEIHELAWGTIDLGLITGSYCAITDYKHGEGIFVDVVENPQLMGYACLVLNRFPFIERFNLRIVQPRCQYQGPREWEISADDLRVWQRAVLKPAMIEAATGIGAALWQVVLKPGPWCRFCKAKQALACPALEQQAVAVAEAPANPAGLTDERLGELYGMGEPLMMRWKAIKDEAEKRALAGVENPHWKTVAKKADRLWKGTAKDALHAALGADKVMADPKLRSPAEIEKLSPLAKGLVMQYAYTPDNGLTIAPMSDRRKAVQVQGIAEKFQKLIDNPAKKE